MNGNLGRLLAVMMAVTSLSILATASSIADAEPIFRLNDAVLGESGPVDPRGFSFDAVDRVRSFGNVAFAVAQGICL